MSGAAMLRASGRMLIVSAIGMFLLSGLNAQVAPESRVLNGNVYYAVGNKPAENVTVQLQSSEGNLIAPIQTDANGWFEFRGLARVEYVIAIYVDGYEPVMFQVDLLFTSSRGNVIYLKPRSADSDKDNQRRASASSVSAHELSMPPKARALMESGKKKTYTDKNPEGGLKDFQGAIVIAPNYYEAYYQCGMANVILARWEEAATNLRKARDVSGDRYGEADIGLGTLLLDKADYAGGEQAIRRGLELSPGAWIGHYELARALLNQNKIEGAEKAVLQARSLSPNAAIVYRLLSNVHLRQKNYPALLEDLEAYLRLDADSPAATRARELREEVKQRIAAGKAEPAGKSPN